MDQKKLAAQVEDLNKWLLSADTIREKYVTPTLPIQPWVLTDEHEEGEGRQKASIAVFDAMLTTKSIWRFFDTSIILFIAAAAFMAYLYSWHLTATISLLMMSFVFFLLSRVLRGVINLYAVTGIASNTKNVLLKRALGKLKEATPPEQYEQVVTKIYKPYYTLENYKDLGQNTTKS